MAKLNKVKVQNFKSLVNTEIEFFGDVNMFFGFNNSGKSNIFKFLKILFDKKKKGTSIGYEPSANDKTKTEELVQETNFWSGYIWNEPFLFTKNNREIPITFTVSLIVDNNSLPQFAQLKTEKYLAKDRTELVLEGTITSTNSDTSYLQVTQATLNKKKFYRNEDELDFFFENSKTGKIEKSTGENILTALNKLVLLIDTDRNLTKEISKDKIDSEAVDVKNFKNALYDLYLNAEKNESFNKLITFLNVFEFSAPSKQRLGSNLRSFPFHQASKIEFSKFNTEIEIMLNNQDGRLPLKNFGSGIQQFLYLLTKIYLSKSRIVIIEEIELNLSPLFQRELLSFLKSLMPAGYDQLIFSSHSPFFAKKDAVMIDYIHHVIVGLLPGDGTQVECHDKEYVLQGYDEGTDQSVLSDFYS